ncbi:hypothetical protein SAMN05216226_10284 [Halovenus aranensis]|uniref:SpoIIAA-like n=1 Tax=Halovenus aranensis TaxID=890420 RepID=A0A1G8SQZ6_9EURY|nr:hypothetical protein [Halovenus aranensis]SDJ31175.1 hypothetical protein SAMN05216226_10284 [Halovenus aranensis]
MTVTTTGDGWSVELVDDVLVWEFLPGMELSSFKTDAYPVFEELLEAHDIKAMVTVVRLDDPFTGEVFDIWEQSARRAEEAGIARWAVVADGIKAISLRGKIDTGDLTTLTTEERTEAEEWAHEA